MRKILSKKDSEKKAKRNQLILGVALVLVMFSSVIGYSLMGNESQGIEASLIYDGIKFTKTSGLWNVNMGDFKFSFTYNPKETVSISSEINLLKSYSGKPLYISSGGQESEIYRNLVYNNQIVQRVQYACLEGEKCISEEYPIKTCENNFIIIKESETTEIKQEQNCLFISGKEEELVKIVDSVLYKIIGIQ